MQSTRNTPSSRGARRAEGLCACGFPRGRRAAGGKAVSRGGTHGGARLREPPELKCRVVPGAYRIRPLFGWLLSTRVATSLPECVALTSSSLEEPGHSDLFSFSWKLPDLAAAAGLPLAIDWGDGSND